MVPLLVWTQVTTTLFVTLWLIRGGALGPLEASALGGKTFSPGSYGNYSTVLVAGTATQNSPFSSLLGAVTIASTHCAHTRTDGQAELAMGNRGYTAKDGLSCQKAVTHPTTNRA